MPAARTHDPQTAANLLLGMGVEKLEIPPDVAPVAIELAVGPEAFQSDTAL